MTRIFIYLVCSFVIVGCAKPKIVHIIPPEEAARLTIEGIINDKEMPPEQKAQLIQVKMLDALEHKKKAVETERDGKLLSV